MLGRRLENRDGHRHYNGTPHHPMLGRRLGTGIFTALNGDPAQSQNG